MQRQFTLEYWRDDGWYVGRLREVPGVFSQGESLPLLEANIRDAYRLLLDGSDPNLPAGVQTKEIGVEVEAP
jgi:predicted RNase H-like HicB family nuclease